MSGPENKEGILGRWSRLKTDTVTRQHDVAAPPAEGAGVQPGDDDGDPEVVAALPDIESLDKDSDYTVFLQEGVPERLKTLALRKLWQSDPVLANLDGLNDYEDDFGAILRDGAALMNKLVEASERMSRSDTDDPPQETDGPPQSESSEREAPVAGSSSAASEETDSDEPSFKA